MPPAVDAASKPRSWFITLAASGLGLSLIACCCGAGAIGAIMLFGDPHPAKLIGAWKGRFILNNVPTDVTYDLRADGTFRQVSYNLEGAKTYDQEGHWGQRNGVIKLSWDGGGYERATVDWIDDNSFHYRIIDQDDKRQIGLTTTFKRQ